ncbi:hypothetical protein I350_04999 [Cryptococcus amylolentus CBS 6273]|uniref:PAS domain-containing protein n=1 Tax=Cryptococcus amylolentus CBS 6273 TaxID=1296118 RepID=A0A1E3JYJ3_9TREE|nr:hypothetical protein I350_04999 [Cryptococcus amylolentus CBS 6273]
MPSKRAAPSSFSNSQPQPPPNKRSPLSYTGRAAPPKQNVQKLREELGLSAWIACNADQEAKLQYVSESMQNILGYTPDELVGKSLYLIFHPDEIPILRHIHYQALTEERTACVAYFRVLHREGYYVECCCSYYTVYNMSLALYTRAVRLADTLGPEQALTAREVIEVSPASQGQYAIKRWTPNSNSPLTSNPSSIRFSSYTSPDRNKPKDGKEDKWPVPPKPSPRTFYILDRFTETSKVMYVSNDVIINGSSLLGQSFYSIIKPSDRPHVQQHIDATKQSTPVMYDQERSGGHGYTTFHVLKIPDLPPSDERWPQGTDESERSMPGQGFIRVEGIFTASSDSLTCIIARVEDAPAGGSGSSAGPGNSASGGSRGGGSGGAGRGFGGSSGVMPIRKLTD